MNRKIQVPNSMATGSIPRRGFTAQPRDRRQPYPGTAVAKMISNPERVELCRQRPSRRPLLNPFRVRLIVGGGGPRVGLRPTLGCEVEPLRGTPAVILRATVFLSAVPRVQRVCISGLHSTH